jgi:hypothetical protein
VLGDIEGLALLKKSGLVSDAVKVTRKKFNGLP